MLLIKNKRELHLLWSRNCIITQALNKAPVAANTAAPVVAATLTTGGTIQINSTKLYAWVVTLSINDDIKFL